MMTKKKKEGRVLCGLPQQALHAQIHSCDRSLIFDRANDPIGRETLHHMLLVAFWYKVPSDPKQKRARARCLFSVTWCVRLSPFLFSLFIYRFIFYALIYLFYLIIYYPFLVVDE
jgi:hypothetical protein